MFKCKSFIFAVLMVLCLTLTSFSAQAAHRSISTAENEEIDKLAAKQGLSLVPDVMTQEEAERAGIFNTSVSDFVDIDSAQLLTGSGITLIGDSIANGNRKIIHENLPDLLIEAKGSRDIVGGFEAAQKLQNEGNLSDVIIVELGTNGSLVNEGYYGDGTKHMLELLGTDKQIFWVTVYCSYSQYMAKNNEFIWNLAKTRPNITVIDWYSLAVQHPEWFPDGVHPNVEGARNFSKLLHDSLVQKYGR